MLARRRALLAGLPVALVGGAYAAWRGGVGRESALAARPAQAAPGQTGGILISNDVGGNFPVDTSPASQGQAQGFGRTEDAAPIYTLRADAAMSQAVIMRQGQGGSHVLNLSIGSPATVNAVPVVAALMLRLDLGAALPTSPRGYPLDSVHLLGDALLVATQMPSGAHVSRQVFKIAGGTLTVQIIDLRSGLVSISLQAVTALASGGLGIPAHGRVRLHSSEPIHINLVQEDRRMPAG